MHEKEKGYLCASLKLIINSESNGCFSLINSETDCIFRNYFVENHKLEISKLHQKKVKFHFCF